MAFKTNKAEEIFQKLESERRDFLVEFGSDPWLGYETLDDALADYKCTTQAEVMARLLNRENVFISGPAGAGKTTLINKFIKLIDAEYRGDFEVAVTASTGIAATLLGGSTIHSWAGLGVDNKPFDPNHISSMMMARARNLRYTDVLIIDEISMLPAYIFEKLDLALRHFRREDSPFGGIQLVLMGDFLQLPPVDRNEAGVNAGFVPTTDVWKELEISYCYMDKTHRATDPKLKEVLSKMSRDLTDDKVKGLVNSRKGITPNAQKTYTTLFTTNKNVDRYNEEQLAANPNLPRRFKATKYGDQKKADQVIKSNNIAEEIELKKDAIVILTANLNHNGNLYANGSIGRVIDFRGQSVVVKFNDGRVLDIIKRSYAKKEKSKIPVKNPFTGKEEFPEYEVATVMQIPLKLGYAITVHKSQGQTFDGVIVDLSQCFTPGLGYVALSRVRTLQDLIVKDINDSAYKMNPISKKLSNYVKFKALKGRADFIENREEYEMILENDLYRSTIWNVEEAGGAQRKKSSKF